MVRDTHVQLYDYQWEWLEQHNKNKSEEIRQALDDVMRGDGVDLDHWRTVYGE